MSTFHGLEMAKQALFAQQSALYTTGHNIANANTEGYSRQRVNFETTSPYPAAARNRAQIPGQMGTGVEAGSIQRIRDQYLDMQYRGENSKAGYWEAKSNELSRMENLLNEPSEAGLSSVMDQFWQALQDLSVNPENAGARSVVIQRGQAVAETFNYLSSSLESIRVDLKNQINTTVLDANSLIEQIHAINVQAGELEPHGYVANDLYDERDRLIDELSSMMNIKVDRHKSADSSRDIADGVVTIELLDDAGKSTGIKLVDGQNLDYGRLSAQYKSDDNTEFDGMDAVKGITIKDANGTKEIMEHVINSSGSLKAYMETYGYDISGDNAYPTGDFPTMLRQLDEMAFGFASAFNRIHGGIEEKNFFGGIDDPFGAAENIFVEITEGSDIHASSENGYGDIANSLANLLESPIAELDNTSIGTYYQSIIGKLGVDAQQANGMKDNTNILRAQVANQRMSVSSVSLDEEMTNLLKFQHAYNAAARMMTSTDELLDRVINNMGLVGR